jgi:hypothetical protein
MLRRRRKNPVPPVPSLEWLREELREEGREKAVENNVPEFYEDALDYVRDTLPEDTPEEQLLDAAWALYYDWLVARISGFDTKVYRAVRLKSLDDLRIDRLGDFWTWDEDAAEPYWAEGAGGDYIIEGIVSREHVDWEKTLYANAILPDEKEIFIKVGAPIYVVSVKEMGDDEVLRGDFNARANPHRKRRR